MHPGNGKTTGLFWKTFSIFSLLFLFSIVDQDISSHQLVFTTRETAFLLLLKFSTNQADPSDLRELLKRAHLHVN